MGISPDRVTGEVFFPGEVPQDDARETLPNGTSASGTPEPSSKAVKAAAKEAQAKNAAAEEADRRAELAWRQRLIETPPPTQGWPVIKFHFWDRWRKVITKPNERELRRRAIQADYENRRESYAQQVAFLREVYNTCSAVVDGQLLRWDALSLTSASLNQKGGSAKTSCNNGLAYSANVLEVDTLLITFTLNDGQAAKQAGVERGDTLNTAELYDLLWKLTQGGTVKANSREVKSRIRHKDHVYVMSQRAVPNDFHGDKVSWMLDQLQPMFGYIAIEGGNAIARSERVGQALPRDIHNTEYEVGRRAHVLIFNLATDEPNSWEAMGQSMDAFQLMLHNPQQRAKLERSLVVVNGHDPNRWSLDMWITYAEWKTDSVGQPSGVRDVPVRVSTGPKGEKPRAKLELIPWDDGVANAVTPDYNALREETRWAYMQAFYDATLRGAADQGRDLTILEKILAAKEKPFDTNVVPFYATTPTTTEDDSTDNRSNESAHAQSAEN